MLPILKRLKETGISGTIIKNRNPDESEDAQNDSDSSGKEACGHAILKAFRDNDAKAMAEAVLDLISVGDSNESESEPHSYDAQNIKAGREE